MSQIEAMLSAETIADTVASEEDGESKQIKKAEDKLVALMHVIRRCLRGAAEILGDERCEAVAVASADGMEEEEDLPEEDIATRKLVATGRAHVFEIISDSDRQYLETLRYSVVDFLNRVQALFDKSAAGPAESTSPIAGYANSPSVRTVFMKVFKIVVIQRMAVLKNVDSVKKWFAMSRRMSKSSTSQYMERKLQRIVFTLPLPDIYPPSSQRGAGVSWQVAIGTPEYWIGHDLCARSVCDRVWIQQAQRLKDLSFNATNTELRKHGASSGYLLALMNLAKNCEHEYDAIRSKACKLFQEVNLCLLVCISIHNI